MGIMLSKDQLTEVAEVSGVTDADGDAFDFMDPRVKLKCQQLLSSPEKVKSCNASFSSPKGVAEMQKAFHFSVHFLVVLCHRSITGSITVHIFLKFATYKFFHCYQEFI